MSSNEIKRKELIKKFLDEIEEKLPFWLKNEEEELKDVLNELEEHIEDKVEALEETGKTKFEATQVAISQMGSPSEIIREYKRRGTPKFYITEELFPTYLNVMRYAGIILAIIAAIAIPLSSLVTGLTGGDWVGKFFSGLSSLIIWSIIIAAGVTVLFVWLSYEGYFPEDLKRVLKSKKDLVVEPSQPQIQVPPKTHIEESKKEYPKKLDKPGSLISGGIVTLVFGIIAAVQPFTDLNALINPKFLDLLLGIGIFWVIIGIFAVIHGIFVSWSYQANKVLYPVRAVISMVGISMVILLIMNPQIFPIPVWTEETGFQIYSMATGYYWIYYLVCAIIIIGIIATAINNIYKGFILEEEYFFHF